MDNTFDELFEEFMKGKEGNEEPNEEPNEWSNKINLDFGMDDLIKTLVFMFTSNKNVDATPDEIEKEFNDFLNSLQKGVDIPNGYAFTLTNLYGNGDIPFEVTKTTFSVEKSLEVQLTEAIENEDYEKAAQLRDLINSKKK